MTRKFALAVFALALTMMSAAPAAAHVTVSAQGEAVQGGFARLHVNVPNERDDSATVEVQLAFPEENPIANVSVQPRAGWTHEVERVTIDPPLEVHGEEVTERVASVTWTGGSIGPGEFEQFLLSAGPMPETDELEFGALQTYDNGEVVRWIEEVPESGEEPELPAPILTLTASDDEGTGSDASESEATAATDTSDLASSSDVDDVRLLSIVAIVVGAIGIVLGGLALLRRRSA